jgi:hypothetical protein
MLPDFNALAVFALAGIVAFHRDTSHVTTSIGGFGAALIIGKAANMAPKLRALVDHLRGFRPTAG